MRDLLKFALILGLASGAAEVALRVEPRLGLSPGEIGVWLALAAAAGLAVTLPAAVAAQGLRKILDRPYGLTLAALIALHAALWYRFEVVLNLFVRDPKVWGGLIGIAAVSLAAGLALDGIARRMNKPLLLAGGLCLGIAMVLGSPPSPAQADGPNVLLITLDTTRPDRLGPYGGPADTPTLDRLAAEGAVFEQAIAPAPLTEPSHLALFSGRPVHATGVVSNGTPFGERPEMLQHRFQALGYRTAGFVSGFPLHAKWGWAQGFDVYDDDFGDTPGMHRLSLVKALDQIFLPGNTLRERYGEFTTARASRFLTRHAEGRWFAWVHLFDPHGPYEVDDAQLAAAPRDGEPLDLPYYWPPPYKSITDIDWLIDSYDQEIAKSDGLIGDLIDLLESRGVLDDTIVIVTADHGESLTEHDYLFDHGDYLYDASLRIPLIVRYPAGVTAGQRVECQVSTTDLPATLATLAGVAEMDDWGRDLSDAMQGAPCSDAPVVSSTIGGRFMANPPVDRSLRSPTTKYILHAAYDDKPEREEMYDLTIDPDEDTDLALTDPFITEAPRTMLNASLEGATETSEVAMDPATVESLRALGYVE